MTKLNYLNCIYGPAVQMERLDIQPFAPYHGNSDRFYTLTISLVYREEQIPPPGIRTPQLLNYNNGLLKTITKLSWILLAKFCRDIPRESSVAVISLHRCAFNTRPQQCRLIQWANWAVAQGRLKFTALTYWTGCKFKLSTTLLPFSAVFRTDARFWHGVVEFACSGALVNVQP
ncbi:hypothetical protein AVEN_124538-1, partial [Araneus ventricosus]